MNIDPRLKAIAATDPIVHAALMSIECGADVATALAEAVIALADWRRVTMPLYQRLIAREPPPPIVIADPYARIARAIAAAPTGKLGAITTAAGIREFVERYAPAEENER